MEPAFLRLTHSPTIHRHQLRLPPINTTRPTPHPQHPCCENHHLHVTAMAAETLQEQDHFPRLSLSPAVQQHQRRLPPTPATENQYYPRGAFVDELHEFPQPPSSSTESVADGDDDSCKCMNPFCESPCDHHRHRHPKATAPTNLQVPSGASKSFATAAGGRAFEDRFGDLPAPIQWRLVEACKTAMRGLVDEVTKEMQGSDAQTTLPEDVRVWRDVMAAAKVVGVDVEATKQQLMNAIRGV